MRCPIVFKNSEDSQLAGAFSADGDRTWAPAQPEPALHNAKSKGFFGRADNGTLIEVAPGDFRAVWDSGTSDTPRTHIHFGKLRIAP